MTFPEDQVFTATQPVKPPSYALGLLLNVLLPGSGFTYINRWPWHLGWMVILFLLSILGSLLAAATQSMALSLLPLLGWIAQLVHYHLTYQRSAAQQFRPVLQDGAKIAFIAGHVVLGVILTGITAAVLIPNLLGARMNAQRAAERAYAFSLMTQVMLDQAEGKPLSETCPVVTAPTELKVTACQVNISDPENLTMDITFESGRTVHLP